MPRSRQLLAILVLAAVTPAAWAAKPEFTLGKAVPSDVFIYVHGAYNPEAEYLHKYWGEVWTAFKETGVIEDVHQLIATNAPPADRERFDNFWKRAGELIDGVDWDARMVEAVYASRMGAPVPEFLLLVRYEDDEKAGRNGEAFGAVLKELETVTGGENGGLVLSEQETHGAKIRTLTAKDAPFLNLRVAVRGAVVAVSIDRGLLDESLSLLAGEGEKKGLPQSERYTQAMAKLPPPEDVVVFFDVKAMIEGLRGMIAFVLQQGQPNQSTQDVSAVAGKVLDEVSILDYLASTTHTESYRQIDETVVMLAADASKSRLYKVFCQPELIEKFDRFIPKEAKAYSVSSGIDWTALYAGVLDFIGKEVPDGAGLMTRWEDVQNQMGFNPERDLFAWLGSQMVSVTLPAATPTPFSNEDKVFMIKVRDEKQAAEKIQAGLDKLNQFLTSFNQPLTSQPAEVPGTTGFRSVTHPFVAMFIHPVYGVAEGYLIVGSSPAAIQTCLATAKGEHPGVSKNERVTREGLIPKGPVASASFTDLTQLGREIAQGLGAVGMVAAMIPNQPETQPIRGVFGILSKLSPVAMKLDFFVSESSVTTFQKNAWHTRTVMNYREPKAKTETAATSGM